MTAERGAERVREICYGIAIHVDGKADFPGEESPFALDYGPDSGQVAILAFDEETGKYRSL